MYKLQVITLFVILAKSASATTNLEIKTGLDSFNEKLDSLATTFTSELTKLNQKLDTLERAASDNIKYTCDVNSCPNRPIVAVTTPSSADTPADTTDSPPAPTKKYPDCCSLQKAGFTESKVCTIDPFLSGDSAQEVQVFCDMDTDGGGWTVFQRRLENSAENFTRDWVSYQKGFGNRADSYWLGLDAISALAPVGGKTTLRIEVNDKEPNPFRNLSYLYTTYEDFSIDPTDLYRLNVNLASFKGNGGNGLINSNGMQFSTVDRDNDNDERICIPKDGSKGCTKGVPGQKSADGVNCAVYQGDWTTDLTPAGAWWNDVCEDFFRSGLNGEANMSWYNDIVDDRGVGGRVLPSHSDMKLRDGNFPKGCAAKI